MAAASSRLESLERLAKRVRAPGEDAGIPQVAAIVQERCGGRGIGLLDEAVDGGRVRRGMQPLAGLDVAVAGGRMGRHHAEGDEVAALRDPRGLAQRFDERLVVGDEVVRRQDDPDLVALALRAITVASAAATAVERASGSPSTFSGGSCGSWSWVARTWAWLVMT